MHRRRCARLLLLSVRSFDAARGGAGENSAAASGGGAAAAALAAARLYPRVRPGSVLAGVSLLRPMVAHPAGRVSGPRRAAKWPATAEALPQTLSPSVSPRRATRSGLRRWHGGAAWRVGARSSARAHREGAAAEVRPSAAPRHARRRDARRAGG